MCYFLDFGEYPHPGFGWKWCRHGSHECGIHYTFQSLATKVLACIAELLLTVLSTAWAYVVIPAGNSNAIHSSHCCRLRIALAWTEALACIAELLMTASSMAWAFA
jgi:hypothetical protein